MFLCYYFVCYKEEQFTQAWADTQKMLSEAGIDASKVSVLDNGEMVKTEGEFWPIVVALVWGWASSVANAPAVGGQTYGGTTGGYIRGHIW